MELILRKPAAESARQAVQRTGALRKSHARCRTLFHPGTFQCMIRAPAWDLGALSHPPSPLASLSGRYEYWIEVAVPVRQLGWIEIPKFAERQRSMVRVYNSRPGVNRSTEKDGWFACSSAPEEGLLARLLVAVKISSFLQVSTAMEPRLSARTCG